MTDVVATPEPEVTMQDVFRWYELQEQLAKVKAAEMELRLKVVKQFFPTPREGTNSHDLTDGYVMKAKCPTDRKIDEAVLTTMADKLREAKIPTNKLIVWKPELAVKEYRKLEEDETDEGKKKLALFDQCLVIKPGCPALEIVLPKRNTPAA